MNVHFLWVLLTGAGLLLGVSGCNITAQPIMRYVQAASLAKFLPPDATTKTMPVGDWVSLQEEIETCPGDRWEFSLRWEASPGQEEVDHWLSVWFVLPDEHVTYHGALPAKTDAGFAIPVQRHGTLQVRTISPYVNAVISMNATRGRPLALGCQPGAPQKTPFPDQIADVQFPDALPAEARETFGLMLNSPVQIYYRAELSWSVPVDLDLSSHWVLNGEIPILNWRQREYGGSGLDADINNLCLSAVSDPMEVFHWYLPIDDLCAHMDEMRFHVTYYSSCGRRLPSGVEATLTIFGPGSEQPLGSETHTFMRTGQVAYFTLSEILEIPACPPGWRERPHTSPPPQPPQQPPPVENRRPTPLPYDNHNQPGDQ